MRQIPVTRARPTPARDSRQPAGRSGNLNATSAHLHLPKGIPVRTRPEPRLDDRDRLRKIGIGPALSFLRRSARPAK